MGCIKQHSHHLWEPSCLESQDCHLSKRILQPPLPQLSARMGRPPSTDAPLRSENGHGFVGPISQLTMVALRGFV